MNDTDIQLEASFVQNKFIQIIFNDLSFTRQKQNVLEKNTNELLILINKYGGLIFFQCILILIVSTVIITQIIKPIAEMINIVELQIQTSSLYQVEDMESYDKQPSNIIIELQNLLQILFKDT